MIEFPNCTLQQAAVHGAAMSFFFDSKVLKKPHSLAFEKILFPAAFFKKKMYAAFKYEEYGENAKGKVFARGLSAVRRDNALLVKNTVLAVMDLMFKRMAPRDQIVAYCGQQMAHVVNSAALVYDGPDRDFDGRLGFQTFVQSAGISKDLADYDADNSATVIAKQMLEKHAQCGIGKNSRVTFVVTLQPKGTKRCQQVLLPSTAQKEHALLDSNFYTGALMNKLAPLMSVLFMDDARASRRTRDLHGNIIYVEPSSAAERKRLLGEALAEKAIEAAFKNCRVIHVASQIRPAPETKEPASKKKKTAQLPILDARQKTLKF
jgi:hypothetical protein